MSLSKSTATGRWETTRSPVFQGSLERHSVVFKDLPEKLDRFIDIKTSDPLNARYGKHDGPMTGPLKGFSHAHLRDDAIVLYHMKGRKLNLIAVVSHAEVEGKRCLKFAERMKQYA